MIEADEIHWFPIINYKSQIIGSKELLLSIVWIPELFVSNAITCYYLTTVGYIAYLPPSCFHAFTANEMHTLPIYKSII